MVNHTALCAQVQTPDVARVQRTYTTHSLVMTYKYLYVVREDYILCPLPTYGVGPPTRPQFEIIHSLPVSGRISGIQVSGAESRSGGAKSRSL